MSQPDQTLRRSGEGSSARSDFAFAWCREETWLLSVTGRNKQTNKENRRNGNEKEAGDEAEVGGFHDLR